MWILHFDLYPGGEDSVDLVLSATAIFAGILLLEAREEQAVPRLVGKRDVGTLEPQEVGLRDARRPTLQHQLLTFNPWSRFRLLGNLHTLYNNKITPSKVDLADP